MEAPTQVATTTDDFEVEDTGTAPAASAPVEPSPARSVVADQEADERLEASADAGDEAHQSPEPTPEQKKDKRSLQARIDAAVAKQREAERRAEAAERAIEQYRQPRQPEPAAVQARPQTPQYTRPKPTEDEIGAKYQSYPEFVEDLTDWKIEQRDAQQARAQHQRAVAERHEAHASKFVEKIAQAEQTDPQFWTKIDPAVANLRPSSALQPGERANALNAIADIIFDSEHSTALMAQLRASDLQRLSTLPPAMLYREMGRLEASVSRPAAATSGPAPKTPVISQAPPPIKPVGTSAQTGEVDPIADDLDVDEHIRIMNARDQKGRFKSR